MVHSRICIDTGVLIRFLRGEEPSASALDKCIRECDCHITAINAYEILYGLARSKHSLGEDALVDAFTVLPFDAAASRRAAQLHHNLISRNQDIGVKDVLIAAICLEHQLPLLTLNTAHFERVDGLTVLRPEMLLAW